MEKYEMGPLVGKGSFGSVVLVRRYTDGAQLVMKRLPLQMVTEKEMEAYQNEVRLLSELEHPGIVCYIESFVDRVRMDLCIVMSFCLGEDHQVLTNWGFLGVDEVHEALKGELEPMETDPMAYIEQMARERQQHEHPCDPSSVPPIPPTPLPSTPAVPDPSGPLLFASYNPTTGCIEYHPARGLIIKPAPEQLVQFTNATPLTSAPSSSFNHPLHPLPPSLPPPSIPPSPPMSIDLLVTDDHDMLVRHGYAQNEQSDAVEPRVASREKEHDIDWNVEIPNPHDHEQRQLKKLPGTDFIKVKAGSLLNTDRRSRVQLLTHAAEGICFDADIAAANCLPPLIPLSPLCRPDAALSERAAFLHRYGYCLAMRDCMDGRHASCALHEQQAWMERAWSAVQPAQQYDTDTDTDTDAVKGNPPLSSLFPTFASPSKQQRIPASENEECVGFPSWVWRLDKSSLRQLIDGMCAAQADCCSSPHDDSDIGKCDSAISHPYLRSIVTSSIQIRDDLIRICLHAGYAAHFFRLPPSQPDTHDHHLMQWRVYFSDDQQYARPILHSYRDIRHVPSSLASTSSSSAAASSPNATPDPVPPSPSVSTARVWCVNVPPHNLIIARRARVESVPRRSLSLHATGREKDGKCGYVRVTTEASMPVIVGNCEGGDLSAFIKQKKGTKLTENEVKNAFVQMALALHFMHEKNILHRDLKAQNIFLKSNMISSASSSAAAAGATSSSSSSSSSSAVPSAPQIVQLGDFGISKVLNGATDLASTCIGTPYYMSPELFKNKPYNHKSDIWALGCILYELTCLRHAFDSPSINGLASKVIQGVYPPVAPSYSKELRSLIREMLEVTPNARPSLKQILHMPWLNKSIKNYVRTITRQVATATAATSNKQETTSAAQGDEGAHASATTAGADGGATSSSSSSAPASVFRPSHVINLRNQLERLGPPLSLIFSQVERERAERREQRERERNGGGGGLTERGGGYSSRRRAGAGAGGGGGSGGGTTSRKHLGRHSRNSSVASLGDPTTHRQRDRDRDGGEIHTARKRQGQGQGQGQQQKGMHRKQNSSNSVAHLHSNDKQSHPPPPRHQRRSSSLHELPSARDLGSVVASASNASNQRQSSIDATASSSTESVSLPPPVPVPPRRRYRDLHHQLAELDREHAQRLEELRYEEEAKAKLEKDFERIQARARERSERMEKKRQNMMGMAAPPGGHPSQAHVPTIQIQRQSQMHHSNQQPPPAAVGGGHGHGHAMLIPTGSPRGDPSVASTSSSGSGSGSGGSSAASSITSNANLPVIPHTHRSSPRSEPGSAQLAGMSPRVAPGSGSGSGSGAPSAASSPPVSSFPHLSASSNAGSLVSSRQASPAAPMPRALRAQIPAVFLPPAIGSAAAAANMPSGSASARSPSPSPTGSPGLSPALPTASQTQTLTGISPVAPSTPHSPPGSGSGSSYAPPPPHPYIPSAAVAQSPRRGRGALRNLAARMSGRNMGVSFAPTTVAAPASSNVSISSPRVDGAIGTQDGQPAYSSGQLSHRYLFASSSAIELRNDRGGPGSRASTDALDGSVPSAPGSGSGSGAPEHQSKLQLLKRKQARGCKPLMPDLNNVAQGMDHEQQQSGEEHHMKRTSADGNVSSSSSTANLSVNPHAASAELEPTISPPTALLRRRMGFGRAGSRHAQAQTQGPDANIKLGGAPPMSMTSASAPTSSVPSPEMGPMSARRMGRKGGAAVAELHALPPIAVVASIPPSQVQLTPNAGAPAPSPSSSIRGRSPSPSCSPSMTQMLSNEKGELERLREERMRLERVLARMDEQIRAAGEGAAPGQQRHHQPSRRATDQRSQQQQQQTVYALSARRGRTMVAAGAAISGSGHHSRRASASPSPSPPPHPPPTDAPSFSASTVLPSAFDAPLLYKQRSVQTLHRRRHSATGPGYEADAAAASAHHMHAAGVQGQVPTAPPLDMATNSGAMSRQRVHVHAPLNAAAGSAAMAPPHYGSPPLPPSVSNIIHSSVPGASNSGPISSSIGASTSTRDRILTAKAQAKHDAAMQEQSRLLQARQEYFADRLKAEQKTKEFYGMGHATNSMMGTTTTIPISPPGPDQLAGNAMSVPPFSRSPPPPQPPSSVVTALPIPNHDENGALRRYTSEPGPTQSPRTHRTLQRRLAAAPVQGPVPMHVPHSNSAGSSPYGGGGQVTGSAHLSSDSSLPLPSNSDHVMVTEDDGDGVDHGLALSNQQVEAFAQHLASYTKRIETLRSAIDGQSKKREKVAKEAERVAKEAARVEQESAAARRKKQDHRPQPQPATSYSDGDDVTSPYAGYDDDSVSDDAYGSIDDSLSDASDY